MGKFFYRILSGFFLGLSIVAPGFSGSVVAIIMGVYQDLVRIVSNPFKNFKENVIYCLPLAIGAVISAILFVFAFTHLFEDYEKATYLLFVGLIAGNIPVIFREVKKAGFQTRYLYGGAIAFAAALALGVVAVRFGSPSSAEGVTSNMAIFAISGFLVGVAAFAPGMSLSTIMIIMGVYGQVLFIAKSILTLNFAYFPQFLVFGGAAAFALVLASRGIKAVFDKHPGVAHTAVLGLIAGSLIGIFYQSMQLPDPNFTWLLGGGMLAAGTFISILFVILGRTMDKKY